MKIWRSSKQILAECVHTYKCRPCLDCAVINYGDLDANYGFERVCDLKLCNPKLPLRKTVPWQKDLIRICKMCICCDAAVYLQMFKEGLGRLMFERKLYFWLILGCGTYHVPRERGGIHMRYTLGERNLSIVRYLDPELHSNLYLKSGLQKF